MGTYYAVTIIGRPHDADPERLHKLARSQLERVEMLMSAYRVDSEVSRFNAAKDTAWIPVSAETARCVELATEVADKSGGAYTVTVAPLVNLWGFGPAPRGDGIPDADRIEAARKSIGANRVSVRREPPALRKALADARIDLSSIAKGLAVDLAAEALESAGVLDYCVDVGGEVRVRGRNPHRLPWRVAVEAPAPDEQSVQRIVPLTTGAIATSGDYRIYIEQDGVRYSHLIDPRTGWPVRHELVSVSVLDASCARADAWATALLVAGPEEGRTLAMRENLSALFILRTDAGLVEQTYGTAWQARY